MEILLIIDKVLKMRPVRWLLLVFAALMLVVSAFSLIRQKALSVQLDIANGRNSKCVATVEAAEARTAELEKRVKASADDIARLDRDYTARLDRIKNTRMTSDTCAGMIAESVRLIQEGRDDAY